MLHSLLRSAGGDYNNRKCSRAETFCCSSARHARNASAEQEAEITCCWKLCPSWTCEILQNWAVNKHHIFAIKMDYLVCLGLAVVLRREREREMYKTIFDYFGGDFLSKPTFWNLVCEYNNGPRARHRYLVRSFSLLFTEFVSILQYSSQSFFTQCSL